MPARQGRYWLLTIPQAQFTPFLPEGVSYIRGQLETGSTTGYIHWQVLVCFEKKVTLHRVKDSFGSTIHAEYAVSTAALGYVWKEDTRVEGTQFELGSLPINRNSKKDWDAIRKSAQDGDFTSIPSDVFIRSYGNLKRIHVDSLKPTPQEKEVYVFWGRTGSGKSRRAWDEATFDAFPKDPCTKWWCGYSGHENVVIDEFRGQIGISHILRWFDRYPTIVESKGSNCVLAARKIWITSNISPDDWYPDLDQETKSALRRRFTNVTHFN